MQKIKVGRVPPCGGGNYSNLTLNEGTEGLYPHSTFWISPYLSEFLPAECIKANHPKMEQRHGMLPPLGLLSASV